MSTRKRVLSGSIYFDHGLSLISPCHQLANSFHKKAGRSQDGFVLFCFVLFCFVLFCFVLFCFVYLWILALTEPPLSPSFHPQSLMSDFRSLQVGRPRYSRCCDLIIDLGSHLIDGSWARS